MPVQPRVWRPSFDNSSAPGTSGLCSPRSTAANTPSFLTFGGEVFGNPMGAIWDAIHWAIEESRTYTTSLDVLVNTRLHTIDEPDRDRAIGSGGHVIHLHR